MCRINGILCKNISESLIVNMRDTLSYGGPDDAGIYIDKEDGIGLGHRRLSIIDLTAAGHQPMHWNNLVIIFNGEIYNYKEITTELYANGYTFSTGSDTEVIIKSFECWGYDCVKRFRGMFAFAIWDKDKKKLTLCRDRIGVKPLYWYYKNGLFMFASELKAFYKNPDFDKTINSQAVSLYLQTGYIKSPFSIFKFANKLEPGNFLEVDENFSIKKWSYWNIRDIYGKSELRNDSDSDLIIECENLLTESFQLRMVADVPIGMFLSGGIDSSIVTALLQKESTTPLNTFTIGFEDKKFNEANYAKLVAQHLGTNHTELYCKEADFKNIIPLLPEIYDEPFGDSSAIPTYLVSSLARKSVTVSLSADAGDEIFTGYNRYLFSEKYFDTIRKIPKPIRFLSSQLLDSLSISQIRTLSNIFNNKYINNLDSRLPKLIEILKCNNSIDFLYNATINLTQKELFELFSINEPIFNRNISILDKRKYSAYGVLDIESYLEGDILTKVDRATMNVALEGREPFLDHKIIEFAMSLPDNIKLRNGETKWILRQILYKYVPKNLIERPKMGFGIPLDSWLSTILKPELELLSRDNEFATLFGLDNEGVSKIVSSYLKGKYNKPNLVWFLYILHQWYLRWLK